MEKTILVHNVDADVYQKFAGKCKGDKVKIGIRLTDLMKQSNGQINTGEKE